MAKDKGQTRGIRISDRFLIAMALLIGITLIAAVFVVPKYGKVFSEYRTLRTEYKTAETDLAMAKQESEDLTAKTGEMKAMLTETEALQKDVFTLAAKVERDIIDGNSNKRICYITLDDGPYNRGKKFIELFSKYGVKATFFLTTANGDKLPDQADLSAKSMYPEYLKYGHTIGNHTYSHNYSNGGVYSSADAFMSAVHDQQEFTEKATGGYKPEIVRFPGGTSMAGSNLESIQKALREEGLGWADWTVDSGDSWGNDQVSSSLIINNVKEAAKDQKVMVILFHEWSQPSLEAMPEIIEYLQDKGYIFLPLFPGSKMVQR